ncbi:MAG: hypothetical protein A2X86_22440 [Bdellovibrionales bacterium GWA2_49_15]|nr:MAG: hypothetical protein A2X86_22440 [Bdellovibrionales bacterium GWA2_49_15]HAZ14222.1 hypothetical protein [Bdellovibrionales bacterium]
MSEVLKIKNEEGDRGKTEEGTKKRGRKPKNFKEVYRINREQTKFFVDLTKEKENLDKVFQLLESANQKPYGKEILFKDLALFAIDKVSAKDIEKLQEGSLTEMEKVDRALDEFNKKNGTNLGLGEFLVKKLSIS